MRKQTTSLEVLEQRIAPAATVVFLDADGDTVTVQTSKGTSAALKTAMGLTEENTVFQLTELDLAGLTAFRGTTISITAEPGEGGDGFVNVGYINATGIDLGMVEVDGDLGQIDAGDFNKNSPAVTQLKLKSLGVMEGTQAGTPDFKSSLPGGVSSISVEGDVKGTISIDGKIGTLYIGGSLIGGATTESGSILTRLGITTATIDGTLQGGEGESSGSIRVAGSLGTITVGGLEGGVGPDSGSIIGASGIKSITVVGAMEGGDGPSSGTVKTDGNITAAYIGSLVGGVGGQSGAIGTSKTISYIEVNNGITGGAGPSSGTILAGTDILSAEVGGNIQGGGGNTSGGIFATRDIRSVIVYGSVIGSETGGGLEGFNNGSIGATRNILYALVDGNLQGGAANVTGTIAAQGSLGTIQVTGSLLGGGGLDSGAIGAAGNITKVKVSGNLTGGDGQKSGSILASSRVKEVTVTGVVQGGLGPNSGNIAGASMFDVITVGGLQGGNGPQSGAIGSFQRIGSVTVNGTVQGGVGNDSGQIVSGNSLGKVKITGSLLGGGGTRAGSIVSVGDLGSLEIGGNFTGGDVNQAGYITAATAGSVRIGQVLGGDGMESAKVRIGTVGTIIVDSLSGGVGQESAMLQVDTATKITVNGGMTGGFGIRSANINVLKKITDLEVGGVIQGYNGGSGMDGAFSANLKLNGSVRNIFLGELAGGDAMQSGTLLVEGSVAKLAIEDRLLGGNGTNSGSVFVGYIAPGSVKGPATLTTMTVGGQISGGGDGAGSVYVSDRLGSLVVGDPTQETESDSEGGIVGSNGTYSGSIVAGGTIGSVVTAGGLNGGFGNESGKIQALNGITSVKIGTNFSGSNGSYDTNGSTLLGQIATEGRLGSLVIGLSVIGSSGQWSATARAASIGTVSVGFTQFDGVGEWVGGNGGDRSASLVAFAGDITSVSVNSSIYQTEEGSPVFISASGDIGSVEAAAISGWAASGVWITAGGNIGTVTGAFAINKTRIIAGYDNSDLSSEFGDFRLVNYRAQIGTVSAGVGASVTIPTFTDVDVVAGTAPGDDGVYGTMDDINGLGTGHSGGFSRIGRIIIGGTVGTGDPDYKFGIVAEQIASITVAGNAISLQAGRGNDVLELGSPGSKIYVNENILAIPGGG